jgi:hypothetical protein
MADWLLGVQLENGAFPGGQQGNLGAENLFNTGQVLSGLTSAGMLLSDEAYLRSAQRAADWMCDRQSPDGTWSCGIYDRDCRTYYSRAVWPLAATGRLPGLPGGERYLQAACRFAGWMLGQRNPNGTFGRWGFHAPRSRTEWNVLHTIAYALEGLLELGLCLQDSRFETAAIQAAERLLRRFEIDGVLYGEYDAAWRPSATYVCVTGSAQTARIWGRCYERTGDVRFFNGLAKMNDALRHIQPTVGGHPAIVGGFPGSVPIYARYQPNLWPNWAAKFALDAFLIEHRLRPAIAARCAA